IPRKPGSFQTFDRASLERNAVSKTAMLPSGRRTATDMQLGARIITPSMTACPPMYGFDSLIRGGRSREPGWQCSAEAARHARPAVRNPACSGVGALDGLLLHLGVL